MLRLRASAIIIQDNSLLLIRRENERGLYYVFPGGGIEAGETSSQAIVREMKEEAGIQVEVVSEFHHLITDYDYNTFLICRQLDKTNPDWQEKEKQTHTNSYDFEWVHLNALNQINLLPLEIRDLLTAQLTK